MIYDTYTENINVNVCIIGSGIAGGTLAVKLAERGIAFLIVEAGGLKGDSSGVSYENAGRPFGLRSTTSIQLGGTSNLWHGVLAPLDEIDFNKRDWIPNSGWPITLNTLKPFYDEAADIFNVAEKGYFQRSSLSAELYGQLDALEYDKEYLKNKLFQQPLPAMNFKDAVMGICSNSDRFHCCCNSTALEFVRQDGKVKSLKLGLADGSFATVQANCFIVCSGALETPRLLLNSGFSNPNIGRYLMDHPMGNLCQLEFLKPDKYPIYSDTKYRVDNKIKSGLEMTYRQQEALKLPNNNFYLRPSFVKGIDNESEKIKLSLLSFKDGKVSLKDLWKVVTSPNVVRQILAYKFSLNVTFKYADLFFVTEQIPNPESNVRLSEKRDKWGYQISRVDWQVSEYDIYSMKVWFELLLTKLFPKEHYRFTHTLNDFNWEEIFTSAIHHVGTARMGHSEDDGVVDKNLQVFGEDNLYVCDGSVFTTAGNVNNGLTIAALACRLAGYLEKDLCKQQ